MWVSSFIHCNNYFFERRFSNLCLDKCGRDEITYLFSNSAMSGILKHGERERERIVDARVQLLHVSTKVESEMLILSLIARLWLHFFCR